jgi:Cu+-exporting ATPase
MMLSFPEYFSSGNIDESILKKSFGILNLLLAVPVFFYCASEFFISAWKGIRQKFLNIDAPIALAIVITFLRSIYELTSGTGPGYLDSMSGIVFFMLIGRFFQDKTYSTLTFDRDYRSYFPLGVSIYDEDGNEKQIPVSELKVGQRMKIHSDEIVPADAMLFLGKSRIDYSFVTGESVPVEKQIGEIIYAGGKQIGGAIELEVIREVSQSYLTQLWNNSAFSEEQADKKVSFIHALSRNFTWVLFSIAAITAVYWQLNNPAKMWGSVTAILIVACPCALLLSANFTNGNMLRVLQKFGFYARNANVLEQISEADTVVFDKTGTLSLQKESQVIYEGAQLDSDTAQMVRTLALQSSHPLSRSIVSALPVSKPLPLKHFEEEKGKGLSGRIGTNSLRLGSAAFVNEKIQSEPDGSKVYLRLNDDILGCFTIQTKYREGLAELISRLKSKYKLALLSGDNASEQKKLAACFGSNADLLFEQKPEDKMAYIETLQKSGHKVIMLGDGLNDAGALKQSHAGIAVTDNINNFSPACDVIFEGRYFTYLDELIRYCKREKTIILGSFILSILYNIVGLAFAVRGELQPVIAAILMPVSSISIVIFTTGMSSILAAPLRKKLWKEKKNTLNV